MIAKVKRGDVCIYKLSQMEFNFQLNWSNDAAISWVTTVTMTGIWLLNPTGVLSSFNNRGVLR